MRFLIIFIFLLSNSFASEDTNIKNLVINKELKKYNFEDRLTKDFNNINFNIHVLQQKFCQEQCYRSYREFYSNY